MSRVPLRMACFTSPMALVMRISRGHASVQLKNRAAAPHALAVVQDLQPFVRRVAAAVEDEAVRVHESARSWGSWWCTPPTCCTSWYRQSARGRPRAPAMSLTMKGSTDEAPGAGEPSKIGRSARTTCQVLRTLALTVAEIIE
jgi:hypothetical protein